MADNTTSMEKHFHKSIFLIEGVKASHALNQTAGKHQLQGLQSSMDYATAVLMAIKRQLLQPDLEELNRLLAKAKRVTSFLDQHYFIWNWWWSRRIRKIAVNIDNAVRRLRNQYLIVSRQEPQVTSDSLLHKAQPQSPDQPSEPMTASPSCSYIPDLQGAASMECIENQPELDPEFMQLDPVWTPEKLTLQLQSLLEAFGAATTGAPSTSCCSTACTGAGPTCLRLEQRCTSPLHIMPCSSSSPSNWDDMESMPHNEGSNLHAGIQDDKASWGSACSSRESSLSQLQLPLTHLLAGR